MVEATIEEDGPDGQAEPTRQMLRLLLIDDDADDVFLVRHVLAKSTRFAPEVVVAHDFEQARRVLHTTRIDVVMADFWLGLDSCLRFLRSIDGTERPPVIVISGFISAEQRDDVRQAGAAGYLAKDDLTLRTVEDILIGVLADA